MAKVTHRVGIVGDINQIYRAMHEPQGLCGWWAESADGNPVVTGIIHLHFPGVATLSFRLTELIENSLIRLHCVSGPGPWQDCRLEFSFQQDKEGVWVTLRHENESAAEEDFLYFTTKWTVYLLSLRDWIETGTGNPFPRDVKIHFGE